MSLQYGDEATIYSECVSFFTTFYNNLIFLQLYIYYSMISMKNCCEGNLKVLSQFPTMRMYLM